MKNCIFFALSFLCCLSLASQAPPAERHERDKPADTTELAAIADRGKAIAAYDRVAWHATDAVQAIHPVPGSITMYLGRQTPEGWVVVFGKLSPEKDKFLLAYEVFPASDSKSARIVAHSVVHADTGDWLHEALAYELARAQLKVNRAYNGAALPASDGGWYVYFYPAQTDNNIFPTGGDYRFHVSADGTKILETHRMHLSILENDTSRITKDGGKLDMTFHTAVVDDAPEDMDVANVIMMGHVPMTIAGRKFVYQIDAAGNPKYLMTTDQLRKIDFAKK